MIPGYLDAFEPPVEPLVDGSPLLAHPLFWPAFLHTVGGSASAPRAFGVEPADLDEPIAALTDQERWPVFSLDVGASCRVHLVMRNLAGEAGVDWVLDPRDGRAVIPLADAEPHARGPALSWPELLAVARQPDPIRTPAERLLLMLPACADRERPDTAADTIAAVLTTVGVRHDGRRVAEELLRGWGFWSPACVWNTVDDALVVSAPAYRIPGQDVPAGDLRLITEAFRTG